MPQKYRDPTKKKKRMNVPARAAARVSRMGMETAARQRGVAHAAALRSQAQQRAVLTANQQISEQRAALEVMKSRQNEWEMNGNESLLRYNEMIADLKSELDKSMRNAPSAGGISVPPFKY